MYRPAAQEMHVVAPGPLKYCPAAHALHATVDVLVYWPAAHAVQLLAPVPFPVFVREPALHAMQLV